MTGAHNPDQSVVGEREERLRETLTTIELGTRDGATTEQEAMDQPVLKRSVVNKLAREALASSPSPPDREQAVEKVAKVLRERTVAHPSVMAEAIVAALFDPVRGDEE